MNDPILAIYTVGGTPEALVHSITSHRPQRVIFVVSPASRAVVKEQILPACGAQGVEVPEGSWSEHLLEDPEDVVHCVRSLRRLTAEIRRWSERPGERRRVIVDITGGTKPMSAALLLVARRWPAEVVYVGGLRRTKRGLGVVEKGAEKIVARANPQDAFGYQAIEDAALLFNQGHAAAAAVPLDEGLRRSESKVVKNILMAVKALVEGYAHWDAFRLKKSREGFDHFLREADVLDDVLWNSVDVKRVVQEHRIHVERLADELGGDSPKPTLLVVLDLAANALRRSLMGRWEEAVAVCYRAVEAAAQARLHEAYGIRTDEVPWDRLPAELQAKYSRRDKDGGAKLALQDAYTWLAARGDALGRRFQELSLDDKKTSPLVARNQSIMAHGFQPVGDKIFEKLFQALLDLTGLKREDVGKLRFPRLEV